jgi:hypothetical protein
MELDECIKLSCAPISGVRPPVTWTEYQRLVRVGRAASSEP